MRQSLKRRERNLKRKEALRRAIREFKRALVAGDKAQAERLIPQLMKAADKAASRYVIHPNKAARIKSRLLKRFQALSKS